MSKLVPFWFKQDEGREDAVRVIDVDGEPWFVAFDVAKTLGYSNAADAIGRHCKGVVKRDTPTPGGVQAVSTIPERDVYRLVMRSKLPAAERFEEWVVGEVLPSIRKTGSYSAAAPAIPKTYAEALRLAADQAEELIQKAMQLEAQKPAVEFVERYVAADGNKGVRQVAQLLNVPNERAFVEWLIESGFMYRLEGNLTPMANQRHTGRFVIKAGVSRTSDHAYNTAKFTPKGISWVAGEWAKHQVRQTELV
jgi:prophage antirepressor-like protein